MVKIANKVVVLLCGILVSMLNATVAEYLAEHEESCKANDFLGCCIVGDIYIGLEQKELDRITSKLWSFTKKPAI